MTYRNPRVQMGETAIVINEYEQMVTQARLVRLPGIGNSNKQSQKT